MLVKDSRTGKMVRIERTEQLSSELQSVYELECSHEDSHVRRIEQRNGSIRIQKVCFECGKSIGQAISATKFDEPPPFIDFDPSQRRKDYENGRRREYESIIQKHVELQVRQNQKLSQEYSAYLRSEEWRTKRHKVLRRAQGICEGCLENPATEVHHLTYENFKDELLFQLIAICRPCHKKCYSLIDDLNGET